MWSWLLVCKSGGLVGDVPHLCCVLCFGREDQQVEQRKQGTQDWRVYAFVYHSSLWCCRHACRMPFLCNTFHHNPRQVEHLHSRGHIVCMSGISHRASSFGFMCTRVNVSQARRDGARVQLGQFMLCDVSGLGRHKEIVGCFQLAECTTCRIEQLVYWIDALSCVAVLCFWHFYSTMA